MNNKRNLLKLTAASSIWASPIVQAILVPAHAQSSLTTTTTITTTITTTTNNPNICSFEGVTNWNMLSYIDSNNVTIISGKVNLVTTVSGSNITIDLVVEDSTGDTNGAAVISNGSASANILGGTSQTGTYDPLTGIASLTSCTVNPGSQNLFCAVTPYELMIICDSDRLTYIETDTAGTITTIEYERA